MTNIYVYAPKSTDWTTNGQAILDPISCEVTEQTGGQYELSMKHPIDDYGKWKYLVNGAIVKAPVPIQNVPAITPAEVAYWRVKPSITGWAIVYAKPLTYTYDTKPSASAWSGSTHYNRGDYCSYNDNVYMYIGPSGFLTAPPSTGGGYWQYISKYETGKTSYVTGGGEVGKMLGGSIFIKLANYNSDWMRIRMSDSTEGYIKTSVCEYYGAMTELIPPRTITEQCFRIYDIQIDSEAQEVNVSARHISYDIYNVIIGECNIKRMTPSTAIAAIQASMLIQDVRTIATNIEDYTVTSDVSWQNAAYALLDPEDGIVAKLKAKLVRDNNDFFILTNNAVNNTFHIEQSTNMVGVTWAVNTENVITRLVPKALNSNDTPLFLPEVYVDSTKIDQFPTIQMELLETDYKVGESYTDEQGVTVTLTAEDCYRLMRRDCDRKYSLDQIDKEVCQMTVDFLNLGDTEEYQQYRDLQHLSPYDVIQIKNEELGIDSQMQMTSYVWDSLSRRYTEATFDLWEEAEEGPLVTRPVKPMTSNKQDSCIVSANDANQYNPVYQAFNNNLSDRWFDSVYRSTHWIQIKMDIAMTGIKVRAYSTMNRSSAPDDPKQGAVYGSNDGATWTQIGSYTGWARSDGGLLGEIVCDNTRPYQYVRLTITKGTSGNDNYTLAIGNIVIEGHRVYV